MPIELKNSQQLSDILKDNKDKLVILDFFTVWCGPCRKLAPELSKIHDSYENVVVVKANAEDEDLEALSEKYQVRAFPTLIFFNENKVVDHFAGADLNRIMAVVNRFK
jgi:thioredoxin 1